MCGIAGLSARERADKARLDVAIARLRHRGPDGDGAFISSDGRVALGHTRLAIIDLSDAGRQPMQSADGRFAIVFNGEIYNFRELRAELIAEGAAFRTHTDTEVLLEGYARWGAGVLGRLNGIFAFAVYDARSGDVFVARDQLGVKPLYYADTADGVGFASELKALQAIVDIDPELDVAALARYLAFLWCPGEQTPLRGVKKLEPGSAMILRNGRIERRWKYWRQPQYAPRRDWSEADCAAELRELLAACVERQMVSDAPLGAFLSGGLDSTAVVAAAARRSPGLQCYTISSDGAGQENTDDLPYARLAAKELGVHLHEVHVGPEEMCAHVEDMVRILDEPLADPACLNVLFISTLARSDGIKVLLSGAGGDDLFTGYRRHAMLALDPVLSAVPSGLRRLISSAGANVGTASALGRRIAKATSILGEDRHARVAGSFLWTPRARVLQLFSAQARAELDGEDLAAPFESELEGHRDLSAVEQCLMLEKRFFLGDHNLIYTDKMAMAASVEVRVPLLDFELVEFAATTPTRFKLRNGDTKRILKQSQRGIVPDACIDRPKSGFGAPLRSWMRHGLKPLADELLAREVLLARGLFDPDAVERLRRQDASGEVDGAYSLFALMCIELWCRAFVDARPTPLAAGMDHASVGARKIHAATSASI